MDAGIIDKSGFSVQLPPDSRFLLMAESVPLVDRDNQRLTCLVDHSKQGLVLVGNDIPGVRYQYRDLACFDGFQAFDDTELFNFVGDLAAPANARRVNDQVIGVPAPKRHRDTVAGRARQCRSQHPVFPGNPVQQGGLADVGPADDGYFDDTGFFFRQRALLRKGIRDGLQQPANPVARFRRDGKGRGEPSDGMKLGGCVFRTDPVDFIDYKKNRFCQGPHGFRQFQVPCRRA